MCVHQAFFEGVEGLIAGGTKVDEVGYRLDYSKNELKKCIKEYPGKEVGTQCGMLTVVLRYCSSCEGLNLVFR